MDILKKIAAGIVALCAGMWIVFPLLLVNSYVFSYIFGHFHRGRDVSGLLLACSPIGILIADGFLMVLALRYVLRCWKNREHRITS